jgi:C4-dicarboxylate-specific signal transduction histidine kinase
MEEPILEETDSRQGTDGSTMETVSDQGPGLLAEVQKELWQHFHRVKGIAV